MREVLREGERKERDSKEGANPKAKLEDVVMGKYRR